MAVQRFVWCNDDGGDQDDKELVGDNYEGKNDTSGWSVQIK